MKRALAVLVLAFAVLAGGAAAKPSPNIVVFGAGNDVAAGGFNTALACCNTVWTTYMGNVEALHGAFVQNARGVWLKDLVTGAKADAHGITYMISPKAFWYWGGRKIPVTYRDFVYTLQKIDDPANDVGGRVGYANLDPAKVEHAGRRVRLFWRTTNCSTDYPCSPYAAWKKLFSGLYPSFALKGLDFNKIWTDCICGSDGKPVSSGPYYLASYTRGQGAVLRANPYYHDRAKVAEVDFKLLDNDALAIGAISDGQVDAIYPSFSPDILALKALAGLDVRVAPIYALEFLDLREGSAKGAPSVTKSGTNALLRAPWMRQAIALALNRRQMIDAVYGRGSGLKPLDNLIYYPNQAGYRPDFARWNYAPAKALALLAKHCTGGPAAPDPTATKTWQCAGLPALFQYTWPVRSSERTAIAQVAKANLRAVGIDVVDRPLGNDVIFGPAGIPSGGFDLAQYLYATDGDPGAWLDNYGCLRPSNYSGYCSHTVDQLFTAASAELDPAKRAALFGRVDALMAAEVPAFPLFQKPGMLVRKSSLVGVEPNAGGFGPFWNIQDWRWKR